MTHEEFIIALISVIAGTTLVGVIFSSITRLIRHWIDSRKHTSQDDLISIAKEFKAYQQNVERRLQNLEAIAAEDKNSQPLLDYEEDDKLNDDVKYQSESHLQNMLKKSR